MMKSSVKIAGALFFLIVCLIAAPGFVRAQETVCIECHKAQPGRLGEPVEAWRSSIHAANGVSCHGCHGGDPTDFAMAMSPERGFVGVPAKEEIPDFCGRCHVGVQEDYLNSAHGQALDAGGPQCVTCHGNHAVQKATQELINQQDCTRCHEYGRAEEIKTAVTETDRMITSLGDDLNSLHRLGIATKEMEDRLFSLRNQFHRVFHTVEVEKVRQVTGGIQQELTQVRSTVDEIGETLQQRKFYGGIAVLLLLAISIVASLLRKTYHEEENRKG
ncbi:cytochrome c [Desulfuromonas sp. TF]|uniref:cytochrome c n=1 Tax=Desulfuromonas sp. TF TaxID=1232410 RepID=UPI000414874D|nr:cytochrome c [Desulfuromonas sp. TF]